MSSRSSELVALILAALMVAGCSNNQQSTLPQDVAPSGPPSYLKQAVSHRRASGADDYLFVGDGTSNIVRIYDFSHSDKPIGQVGIEPSGLCSGSSGNVWITGAYNGSVGTFEFRHDGSGPIAQLSGAGSPWGCAVDPVSGDLAVANWGNDKGAYVDIYRKAQGAPKVYYDSNVVDFYFCAYDATGNLVLQGENYVGQGEVVYAKLEKGSKQLQAVNLEDSFETEVGGIAWDGQYFAVAYGGYEDTVYRYSIADLNATLVGKSTFQFTGYGFAMFAIHKHRLAVLGEYVTNNDDVAIAKIAKFPYPSGTRERHDQTTGLPRGIAISVGTNDLK